MNPAYWPMTSAHGPRSAVAAMTAATPKPITVAGSITRRRRNEKRRCSNASGTEPRVRSRIVPEEAAASAVTVELSKNAPTSGAVASARRLKRTPATNVAKAAVDAAASRSVRRWITADAMPDSVSSSVNPIRTVAAANSPKSVGSSSLASAM